MQSDAWVCGWGKWKFPIIFQLQSYLGPHSWIWSTGKGHFFWGGIILYLPQSRWRHTVHLRCHRCTFLSRQAPGCGYEAGEMLRCSSGHTWDLLGWPCRFFSRWQWPWGQRWCRPEWQFRPLMPVCYVASLVLALQIWETKTRFKNGSIYMQSFPFHFHYSPGINN